MARVAVGRHWAGVHDALSPRIEPERRAWRDQAEAIVRAAPGGVVHSGRIMPLQVEMGDGGADLRGPVVQHAIAIDVGAVHEFLRWRPPRPIPIRAHLAEVAAADAAGSDDDTLGIDRKS